MLQTLRTLPKMMLRGLAGLALLATGAGVAGASSNGPAPVLVPYTITAIAGNTQSSVAGFGGDGGSGLSATLNGPNAMAVDSVGNVYLADQANALIRELNPQTGVFKIIAGVPPTKCTGTTCTTTNPGCADGVPAVGSQVGSRIQGLVVDGYGNVYFSDYNYQGVWVIYKGGAQVANFINLVDSAAVTTAGGVKPGYVYHIAGTVVPKAGGGCTGTSTTALVNGTNDNVLATKALFHDPLQMGIDPAGNLYVQDYANNVVRVINTQATTQTFFKVAVQPGYIAGIVNCSSSTTPCPSATLPFGGPAGAQLYNTPAGMTVDPYGNVYQLNTKGTTTSIYANIAYVGGAAAAHLISLVDGMTANPGANYSIINNIKTADGLPGSTPQAWPANGSSNIVIRPLSIAVDALGNIYMDDYHWNSIYRIDANSGIATRLILGIGNAPAYGSSATTPTPTPTPAAPQYCSGTSGPQTTDAYGDGCPVQQALLKSTASGYITLDGAGNLYISDGQSNLLRKVSVNNQFASTAVGSKLTQTLQLHFDPANLPADTTTKSFTITGSPEFAVSSVSCSNYTVGINPQAGITTATALDASLECYVTVSFSPTAAGTRQATLQAATAGGSVYPFPLTGLATGPQIAVDGGSQSTVSTTNLKSPAAVAVDAAGNVYIADSGNNQVLEEPVGGGKQTTIGTGLKAPQGVAVDSTGNVYISDTGNNRIVEVAAATGTQTTLSTNVLTPQGLAVDTLGNVYVADTGNHRVLEIPMNADMTASPLLAYTGGQALITPVAVAIAPNGNIYVADAGNKNGLIEILAGGGDFQTLAGTTTIPTPGTVVSFGAANVAVPAGVAVDAVGNLYVSDSQGNSVQVLPSATGPGSEPYAVNFTGLNGPTGLALDANGNLYVADTGNMQVVLENRTQPTVNFGIVAQSGSLTLPLTVTNIGNSPLTFTSPFATISGASANFSETDTCAASYLPVGTLTPGLHCSLKATFQPTANGTLTATAALQGGASNVTLNGTGQPKLINMAFAITQPASGPMMYQPATVTVTATQPKGTNVPVGSITFNYTVNGVAQTPQTAVLVPGATSSTANLNLPNLLPARVYAITAVYSGDANDSPTTSTYTFTCPGFPVTVLSTSASFTYGSPVPKLTGSVSGIKPADQAAITATIVSAATSSTPVGVYPITALLTGGNAADYQVANAVQADGTPAVVTENKAPLSITVGNWTRSYGAVDISYATDTTGSQPVGTIATGLVNGDTPTYTYTPPDSQTVPVGTVAIVPTPSILVSGYDRINNYKVTITNGSLKIVQATSLTVGALAVPAVLPTNLTGGAVTITVGQAVSGLFGTPTGTVKVTDVFTPLTASGNGVPVTEPGATLPLVPLSCSKPPCNSTATYTPTDPTIGTHVYTFAYSGDRNFLVSDSTATPTNLIVDVTDYTVVSTSSPVQVAPGIVPGGNAAISTEQAAFPETAIVYIAPILGSTQVVNLTCTTPKAFISCSLSPTSVTLNGTAVSTSTISISTPATLPLGTNTSQVRSSSKVVFALIPVTFLMLLPFAGARKRRLSQLLLVLIGVAMLAGANGCSGGNSVAFFTPVPAGPYSVTVTGTVGTTSRSWVIPINIQ